MANSENAIHQVSSNSRRISKTVSFQSSATSVSYQALGSLQKPELVQFSKPSMERDTEFTGHIVARLSVSVTPEDAESAYNKDIDLFLTLKHISPSGEEVHYTGTAGDPIPLAKGWLRVSMRKVDENNPIIGATCYTETTSRQTFSK
jgi:hypothetical protein